VRKSSIDISSVALETGFLPHISKSSKLHLFSSEKIDGRKKISTKVAGPKLNFGQAHVLTIGIIASLILPISEYSVKGNITSEPKVTLS
jgi:hypothetical protein